MLNIQADLRKRLEDALDGVMVRVAVPADRPVELVVLRRDGGALDTNSILDRPTILIDCWAGSEARAYGLAVEVAKAVELMPFLGGYARVDMDSMYSDFDTVAKSPRWVLSYSFTTFKPN